MGEYANVKRKDLLRLLQWLGKQEGMEVKKGNNHFYNIRYLYQEKVYPVYLKHSRANKHVVRKLRDKLIEDNICTKEEFDKVIK